MRQPILVEVADHDHRGTEDAGGSGRRKSDRTGTGDIDGRADSDAGAHRAMEAGRQDVGEHGEIADLFHRPVTVREFQEVEIGIGNGDVAGLPADPAAHVDIAVGAAGARRIDGQAHAGVLRLAAAAAAAGDVERHGDDIADLEHLDIDALLDDLAGDLVAENKPRHRRGAAAHHMLVRSADIGRDHLQDHAMLDPAPVGGLELRIIDVMDFDLAGSHIDDATVLAHFHLLR
jgi:hypothetical protein